MNNIIIDNPDKSTHVVTDSYGNLYTAKDWICIIVGINYELRLNRLLGDLTFYTSIDTNNNWNIITFRGTADQPTDTTMSSVNIMAIPTGFVDPKFTTLKYMSY
jgi:hypothetical protein